MTLIIEIFHFRFDLLRFVSRGCAISFVCFALRRFFYFLLCLCSTHASCESFRLFCFNSIAFKFLCRVLISFSFLFLHFTLTFSLLLFIFAVALPMLLLSSILITGSCLLRLLQCQCQRERRQKERERRVCLRESESVCRLNSCALRFCTLRSASALHSSFSLCIPSLSLSFSHSFCQFALFVWYVGPSASTYSPFPPTCRRPRC